MDFLSCRRCDISQKCKTSLAGSATLEIQVKWAKSNPSCKLELARFLGGDAPDGKTNKHLATTDRHRGGDAPDGKTNKNLHGQWVGQTDTEGGTHRTERLKSKLFNGYSLIST